MVTRTVVAWMSVLLALVIATRGEAIPAFGRMHRVSCSLCHDPLPRLTPFGETFASNGYRFAPGQPAPDAMPTGDPLLDLPQVLRLAMRVDAFATTYSGNRLMTDFQTPYNVKIMSGGPISEALSYYAYFLLSERGSTGGIEDAFVRWSGIANLPVDVAAGQFQVSDPMFPREVRLEYQDYAIYRARIGDTRADLTYDRGLMVSVDVAGFGFTGEVVNGNGSGGASESRRFDDDRNKSFLGHVSRELPGGLTLGALGYFARQDGAATGGPPAQNQLWMLGADATVTVGHLEVRGQFVHREDSSPTFTLDEDRAVTNGGFAELLWHRAGERWYVIALYNRIDTSRPLLDVRLGGRAGLTRYEAFTGGAGYLVRRNVRAYGEVTWDREPATTQWTLGLTMAF
jgi:hypothetical protein